MVGIFLFSSGIFRKADKSEIKPSIRTTDSVDTDAVFERADDYLITQPDSTPPVDSIPKSSVIEDSMRFKKTSSTIRLAKEGSLPRKREESSRSSHRQHLS